MRNRRSRTPAGHWVQLPTAADWLVSQQAKEFEAMQRKSEAIEPALDLAANAVGLTRGELLNRIEWLGQLLDVSESPSSDPGSGGRHTAATT